MSVGSKQRTGNGRQTKRGGSASVSRKEMKALTRTRLIDAGLTILDEQGETALTTINVTREAGIAQSSFYVHFADMDDLLHSLIDHLAVDRLRSTREARRRARSAPTDLERFRETFRVPISHSIAHPRVFRLMLRSRYDSTSPLGDWSRSVYEENRAALIEDLTTLGLPANSDADRERVGMVADCIVAVTESLITGYLDGRYPDLEAAIDVLLVFSSGYLNLRGDCTADTASGAASPGTPRAVGKRSPTATHSPRSRRNAAVTAR